MAPEKIDTLWDWKTLGEEKSNPPPGLVDQRSG
jgi:hypothetical protein